MSRGSRRARPWSACRDTARPLRGVTMTRSRPDDHARAGDSDDRAVVALIHAHDRKLFHYLKRILESAVDAEDAAQDVWTKFLRKRGAIDPSKAPAWLFRTARRRALDLLRRRAVRK